MSEDFTYLENLISNRKVVRNYKKIEFDYEKLKNMTRGEKVDAESITEFIESLTLSDEHKKTLLKLDPGSYVGMASNIVDQL